MRQHAQIFLQRMFDLVGHPGDDPIPRHYRRPDTRAYEVRQQPSAAPSICASGFFFVTSQHTFPQLSQIMPGCVAPVTLLGFKGCYPREAGTSRAPRTYGFRREQMSISYTRDIDPERRRTERLDIAHRLYQALIAQDPNRAITLCDGEGRAVARHYPTRPEIRSVAERGLS
jgi:hypothetical protein